MGQPATLTLTAALLFAPVPAIGSLEAATRQESKPANTRRDPAPRAPVSGIPGFDSRSQVRFAASPEVIHELQVTCAFPERMRWMISAQIEGTLVRELQYQYGDAVYRIPTGTSASQLCEGDVRTQILRQLHLRRALMLYPDGFEWKGSGPERTTDLGELGSLRAKLPTDGGSRPGSMEHVDPSGRTTVGYRAVTWKETAGRSWPLTLEFWQGDERVWSENVASVDTAARFVESYFVPPDLREGSTTRSLAGGVRSLEIPETCFLRTPLAPRTSWEAAIRELGRLRAERSKRLTEAGLALEPVATFELSDEGEPVASVLRLAKVPEAAPEGFVMEPGRRGVAVAVDGLARADRARIEELRSGLPKGSVAGRPYLRFDMGEGSSPKRVVLVLPFDPPR